MNRDFFVRLAFATHRVADALPQGEEIRDEMKDSANTILVDLILFTEKDALSGEKKRMLLPQLARQIDILLVYLDKAKTEGWIDPSNFSLLAVEYKKLRELLGIFEEIQRPRSVEVKKEKEKPVLPKELKTEIEAAPLTDRQRKILEYLKAKENAQVWEIQKVVPEVTKRTLRRDLDELLQMDLVERKGEWNTVFYELK
jgi:hypothetical protein